MTAGSMNSKQRNSFVINHALRTFFIASVLSSIVTQMNTLVDGIIVSHNVAADAISAVGLATPVFSLVMLLGSMIYSGTALVMAEAFGNQQYNKVHQLFTVSLTSIFVINLALAVLLWLWTEPIARLLTSEERLLPLLNAYLPISFVGNLFFLMQMALAQYVKISGRPGLVTQCVMAESVGNVALDLLLVVGFDMGMTGAALASALATLLSMLIFLPYLLHSPRPFCLVRVDAGSWLRLLGRGMLRGLPAAVGTVVMAALFMGLNALFQKTHGANGLFVLSACVQTLMLSMLVLGGAGSAITGLGGVLMGENDEDGVYRLLKSVFRVIFTGMIVVSLVVFIFPQAIAELFGAKGDLLDFSVTPLRIFSLIFIPIGFVIPLSNLYILINRNVLASAVNVGMLVCLLPLVWLMALVDPEHIWYAMPIGMWILLVLTACATVIISHKRKGLHWLYLISTGGNDDSYHVSMDFNAKDIETKLTDAQEFVRGLGLDETLAGNVNLCLEEVVYNELEMRKTVKKKTSFDVNISNQEERLTVIVKDVGQAYNPSVEYQMPETADDLDERQLNMMIVRGICHEINYQYMNGLNCLYLNFNKKTT